MPGDINIPIRADHEQVVRLLSAVERFGFSTDGVMPPYLLEHSKILQLDAFPFRSAS